MIVILKNVRLAFPQLFEATTVGGEGKPAHSAAFIFPKTHPAYKEMEKAINEVAAEKWTDKAATILKELRAKDKTALHDGDLKSEYDGYAGNFFVNSRNEKRPIVLDRDKTPLTQADAIPYAGCYVNAQVDVWPQDNPKFGKRINAKLLGVQFLKDGDAFAAGASISADDFEEITDDEDDLVK